MNKSQPLHLIFDRSRANRGEFETTSLFRSTHLTVTHTPRLPAFLILEEESSEPTPFSEEDKTLIRLQLELVMGKVVHFSAPLGV